jgi:hypothetical protein
VFEYRVLREIFETKRDEEIGVWRNLRNVRLRNFYSLLDIIIFIKSTRFRWTRHVARIGEESFIQSLAGKPEERRPLGKFRHR